MLQTRFTTIQQKEKVDNEAIRAHIMVEQRKLNEKRQQQIKQASATLRKELLHERR
jgi:hypothetical protein